MKFLDSNGVARLWSKIKDYVAENAGSGGGISGDYLPLTGGTMTGGIVSTSSTILSSSGSAYDLSITKDNGIVMNGGDHGTGFIQIAPGTVTVSNSANNGLEIGGLGIRRINPAGSDNSVWNTKGGITTFKTINNQSIIGSGNISLPISSDAVPLELWVKTSGSSYTNVSDNSSAAGFAGIPFLRPEGLTGDNNGIALIGETATASKEYLTIKAYSGGTPSGSVTYNGPAIAAKFESEEFKNDIHAANIPHVGGTYEFPCSYGSVTRAVLNLGQQSDCHDINLQLYSGPDEFDPPAAAIYAHLHKPLWLTFVSRTAFSDTGDIMCSAFGAGGIIVGKNSGSIDYTVGPQDTYVTIKTDGIDIADPTTTTKIDSTWAKNNFDNIFSHDPEVTCSSARVLDIDYDNKIALIRFTLEINKSATEVIVKTTSSSTVIGGASIGNSKKASIVVSVSYNSAGGVDDSNGYQLSVQ